MATAIEQQRQSKRSCNLQRARSPGTLKEIQVWSIIYVTKKIEEGILPNFYLKYQNYNNSVIFNY